VTGSAPHPDVYRRALSTRGYVVAVVGPLLVAALLLGLVVLNHDDAVELPGRSVPLLTSNWKPGDGGSDAMISGTLELGQDGCVYLTNGADRMAPVWPAEFSARETFDGKLTLYDPHGKALAHDGDELRMGGGFASAAEYRGYTCAPASGEVALVQSEVTVVAP
jgi:hypothetical protein